MPSSRRGPGYLEERERSFSSSRSVLHSKMGHKDGLWPLRLFTKLDLRKHGLGE